LRKISTFTDFFVICSGTSEPQLKAIAGEIHETLKKDHGVSPHAVDGYPASQWVVMDYGDVVVHIFHEQKRDFYGLEELWSDAPRLNLGQEIAEPKKVKVTARKKSAAPRKKKTRKTSDF
jgi:ribosome-associated protein